jgi:hypothetical protein
VVSSYRRATNCLSGNRLEDSVGTLARRRVFHVDTRDARNR